MCPFAIIEVIQRDGESATYKVKENKLTRTLPDAVKKANQQATTTRGRHNNGLRGGTTQASIKVCYLNKKRSPWLTEGRPPSQLDLEYACKGRGLGKDKGSWTVKIGIDVNSMQASLDSDDAEHNDEYASSGLHYINASGNPAYLQPDPQLDEPDAVPTPNQIGAEVQNAIEASTSEDFPANEEARNKAQGGGDSEESGETGEGGDTPKPSPETQVSEEQAKSLEQFGEMGEAIKNAVEEATHSATEDLHERITKPIEVTVNEVKVELPEDTLLHEQFAKAMTLIECGMNVMMVGPAGCGKTHMARQVAHVLSRPYFGQSCSMGMTEGDLLGRLEPSQNPDLAGCFEFQTTPFLEIAANGGVYLLDEMDAADDNVLNALNGFIANDTVGLPRRKNDPELHKHPGYVLLAATNTSGEGAEHGYQRNELDGAFLDRFRMGVVYMDYDRKIEATLVPDPELCEMWWAIRDKVKENRLDNRIVSTRTLEHAFRLKSAVNPDTGVNFTSGDCIQQLTQCWSEVEREACGVEALRRHQEVA